MQTGMTANTQSLTQQKIREIAFALDKLPMDEKTDMLPELQQ